MMMNPNSPEVQGILLINKPKGKTSFSLVTVLRKRLGIRKIGHAGTLDPFATGVMVMLLGRNFTRLSDQFLCQDKEYLAQIHLGISTDTYDCEGLTTASSEYAPSLQEVQAALVKFQGEIEQIPPMFSAKKINGKKLYELARKGQDIERPAAKVYLDISLLNYAYPHIDIQVKCSKGTYIRSLAHDIGELLGCGAHLSILSRTRSGIFYLKDCLDGNMIANLEIDLLKNIRHDGYTTN
jgi:tRNA pseudouridine55 synthase